jgi:hypothetical protein
MLLLTLAMLGMRFAGMRRRRGAASGQAAPASDF